MAAKRPRCQNFTHAEKCVLIELVSRFKRIIENKKTDAASMKEKEAVWMKIATIFNSSTSSNRSFDSIRHCWDNLKKKARRVDMENQQKPASTAEKSLQVATDELLERVKDILNASVDNSDISVDWNSETAGDPKIKIDPDHWEDENRQQIEADGANEEGTGDWMTWTTATLDCENENRTIENSEPVSSDPLKTSVPKSSTKEQRFHKKTTLEKLAEAKLEMTLMALQQAEEEQQMRKELFEIRKQQELAILEMNKIELKRKQLLFQREFGNS